MHVHYLQAEVFTVVEGRLGYQRSGEPERFAGPGDTVAFPPGTGHRFWNAGSGELHTTAFIEPADNAEYILTELFEGVGHDGGAGPDLFDLAFLMSRYRKEFAVLTIPVHLQRALFPLLAVIGRMLGRYARYADAPAPVMRTAEPLPSAK